MHSNRRIYSSNKNRLFIEEQMMSTDENFGKAYPILASYFTFMKKNPSKFTDLKNDKFQIPRSAINSKKIHLIHKHNLKKSNQTNFEDSFLKKQFKAPFIIKETEKDQKSSKDFFLTKLNVDSQTRGTLLKKEIELNKSNVKNNFLISSITSPFIKRIGLMNAFSEITKQTKDRYIDRSLIEKIYHKLKPRLPLVDVYLSSIKV